MSELKEGDSAPDFSLPSTEGRNLSLSEFKGKNDVVLYFYPKDDTPGCTKEACNFRDNLGRVQQKGAVILGMSADPLKSHESFRKKYNLSFPLVSDETKEVLKRYGVWKKKSFLGKSYMGIERSTVVIDKKGIVRKVFPKVKVEGHAEEVLEVLVRLKSA